MKQADQNTLGELNKAVSDAISARREWLDSRMEEYAIVQVGEEIYDLSTGELLGVVLGLYRHNADHDKGVMDTSMKIDYYFSSCEDNSFNSTRRNNLHWVGTKEQAAARKKELFRIALCGGKA